MNDDERGESWHYSESLRPWEWPWYDRWLWRLGMLRDWLRHPECRSEAREAGHTALGFKRKRP